MVNKITPEKVFYGSKLDATAFQSKMLLNGFRKYVVVTNISGTIFNIR